MNTFLGIFSWQFSPLLSFQILYIQVFQKEQAANKTHKIPPSLYKAVAYILGPCIANQLAESTIQVYDSSRTQNTQWMQLFL